MTALPIFGHMTCSTYYSTAAAAPRLWHAFHILLSATLPPLSILQVVQSQILIGFSQFLIKLLLLWLQSHVAPQIPKKRGKQTGRRKQPLPELPHSQGASSADEREEPNLTMVMDLLVGINTRLATHEKQCLDDLMIEKDAHEE